MSPLSLKSCLKFAARSDLRGTADIHRRAKGVEYRLQPVSLPLLLLAALCVLMLFAATQRSIVAQEPPPSAPTDLSASVSAEGITLTWTAPDGQVDGYEILRRRPLQGETDLTTLVDNTGSGETSYVDTSATTPGERYSYGVKTIRGDERSSASDSVVVDFVTIGCEIRAGDNHDILYCMVNAGEQTITSTHWTPSFETQYAQTTSRPSAAWVIADEYCGQGTTVTAAAQSGDSVFPTVETTITLECSPEPTDDLTVSCENLVENDEHILSCALSGGDQTIDSATWLPYFEAAYQETKEGEDLAEKTWVIEDEHYCGQTTTVDVDLTADGTSLPTVSTTVPLHCVIRVDENCSLANAIRSANGNAQVEENGDSDGNDDCETGADPG